MASRGMAFQIAEFGHNFGPRPTGTDYHHFPREFRPVASSYLPHTYIPGTPTVEVRVFSEVNRLRLFNIGEAGVRTLQQLQIAEISVGSDIEPRYAERALKLLSNNYDLLMEARSAQESDLSGIKGFLTTDHLECADFSKAAASYFSDRIDGQRGLIISQYDWESDVSDWKRVQTVLQASTDLKDHTHALRLSDPGVINLFGMLGLKVPGDVHPALRVAQFDLLRIFSDGAVYADLIHIPFELLTAEPA